MTPIIGLTASTGRDSWHRSTGVVPDAYLQAIIEAGGLPLVIPSDLPADSWHKVYSRIDGVLFTGGGDIERWRYGRTHNQ